MIATLILLLLMSLPQAQTETSRDQRDKSLHTIFQTIENETGYKFLYRDAIIAGKKADFTMSDNWQASLHQLLHRSGLAASIDDIRQRVVIYQGDASQVKSTRIEGTLIDNKTGERLPFATVWVKAGSRPIRQTQTDINGRFSLMLSSTTGEDVTIGVSYVGYRRAELTFDSGSIQLNSPLHIRLEPSRVEISEIVVTGASGSTPADSVYRGILDMGTFSPLGESNSVRMLQILPSVSHGASLSEGSYIRGSNSDALRVTLDGSVIYSHSHLFGLIDSFNPDVIRTGSFYYDVAPARYHAPPGGVLNLVTQTGSLHDYGGSFGLSNSVVKGSLDGPIQKGRSSWMLAGRHSILNTIDLFNSSEMVSWGLGIDRENSLDEDATNLNERILDPGSYSVSFYDFHGKLFIEPSPSGIFTLSGYLGGDSTSQTVNRIIRASTGSPGRFDRDDFETSNEWGNRSANVSWFQRLNKNRELQVQAGFSYLYTGYLKEDYVYTRPQNDPDRPPLLLSDFENESELNHGYANVELKAGLLHAGTSINWYDAAYRENSLNRSEFFQRTRPVMAELYGEYRLENQTGNHSADAGIRFQHYTDGNFTRSSPRLSASFFQNSFLTLGLSAGRNYQYLYQLSIYNQTTSDIWVMALDGQPPARSDHLSASLSASPWSNAFIQVEGYLKMQENLRFHEINFQNIEASFNGSPLFNDNEGYSRGAEVLFRQTGRRWEVSQSYTYSITELRNDRFQDRGWFYADWDRRHRFNTVASYRFFDGLKASVNWVASSGRPDRIRLSEPEQDRLGKYSRVDLSLEYSGELGESGGTRLRLQAGVYNLTNRNNPWYREWVQTIDDSGLRSQLSPEQVDVYDLGFQPSVSLGIYF